MDHEIAQRLHSQPQGYSHPLSPTGALSLVRPPPWHFSGDVVWVDYRADPDGVRATLGPELELGPGGGRAALAFAEWQVCGDDAEELDDPRRAQFREFFILLDCEFRGQPTAFCPYGWVDTPLAVVRGLIQGIPKLFGSIGMTRGVDVGRAGPRREAGHRFAATLAGEDRRLVEARVTLQRLVETPPELMTRPLVQTRHFPSWDPSRPPLRELVSPVGTGREFARIWSGEAELEFLDAAGEDLHALAPIALGDGYVYSYAETLVGGHHLDPEPAV